MPYLSFFRPIPSLSVWAALLLSSIPQGIHAQWVQSIPAERPATPKVFALVAKGPHLFAGFESGAFRTSDHGASWRVVNNGMGEFPVVFSLATDGSILFAGLVQGGVYRSADDGGTWTQSGLIGAYVTSLAVKGRILIAGTCCDGLHVSLDLGSTWRKAALAETYIRHTALGGNAMLASAAVGLFRSTDSGSTWTRIAMGGPPADSTIGPFLRKGAILFAGTRNGLYRSQNDGLTWNRAGASTLKIESLAEGGGHLFAGGWEGLYHSSDDGVTWSKVDSGLIDPRILCLGVSGTDLYAGMPGQGIWKRPLAQMSAGVAINFLAAPSTSWGAVRSGTTRSLLPGSRMGFPFPAADGLPKGWFDAQGKAAMPSQGKAAMP